MAGTLVGTTIVHRGRGVVRLKVSFTTDASGDATVTKIGPLFGRLVGVGYKPGDLATGVDLTLTDSETGATLLTLGNAGTSARFIRPTGVITSSVGVAVTAADTAPNVNRDIFLSGLLQLVVAQGGNAKSGELTLFVNEGKSAVAAV